VHTRAFHWSLSWARSIQSIPPHPVFLRSILISSSHLRPVLPSGLFHSRFPIKSYMYSSPTPRHSCYMPGPSRPPWFDHYNYAWRREQLNFNPNNSIGFTVLDEKYNLYSTSLGNFIQSFITLSNLRANIFLGTNWSSENGVPRP
jgi:hypothetical protein